MFSLCWYPSAEHASARFRSGADIRIMFSQKPPFLSVTPGALAAQKKVREPLKKAPTATKKAPRTSKPLEAHYRPSGFRVFCETCSYRHLGDEKSWNPVGKWCLSSGMPSQTKNRFARVCPFLKKNLARDYVLTCQTAIFRL